MIGDGDSETAVLIEDENSASEYPRTMRNQILAEILGAGYIPPVNLLAGGAEDADFTAIWNQFGIVSDRNDGCYDAVRHVRYGSDVALYRTVGGKRARGYEEFDIPNINAAIPGKVGGYQACRAVLAAVAPKGLAVAFPIKKLWPDYYSYTHRVLSIPLQYQRFEQQFSPNPDYQKGNEDFSQLEKLSRVHHHHHHTTGSREKPIHWVELTPTQLEQAPKLTSTSFETPENDLQLAILNSFHYTEAEASDKDPPEDQQPTTFGLSTEVMKLDKIRKKSSSPLFDVNEDKGTIIEPKWRPCMVIDPDCADILKQAGATWATVTSDIDRSFIESLVHAECSIPACVNAWLVFSSSYAGSEDMLVSSSPKSPKEITSSKRDPVEELASMLTGDDILVLKSGAEEEGGDDESGPSHELESDEEAHEEPPSPKQNAKVRKPT